MALLLRPVGYWCLAWVWVVIWAVGVLLAPGSIAYVYFDDEIILGQVLGDTPFLGIVALVVIVVPILVAVMGPGAMFWVPTMGWPLAVLCFIYAFRGLRPSYAKEPLSYTTQAPRGATLGPPTIGTVALSLKPVRRSRFTDTIMKWYMAGWDLHMEIFLAALPAGLGWVCLFGWASRDVDESLRQGLLVAGSVLVLISCVLVTRALRVLFRRWRPDEGAVAASV
ncbi:hypothetical protein [Promicromonospora soli]